MHTAPHDDQWLDIANWHAWLHEPLRGEAMEHRDLR